MKIGDRCFVHGYIDEIRKDTVIVRNDGGYFGTIPSEVTGELPSAQPEPIKINIDDFNKEDLERFKKELGNTPITVLPAQPEIIRCKDCKYFERRSIHHHGLCDVHCNGVGEKEVTSEGQYCSWAERKEE